MKGNDEVAGADPSDKPKNSFRRFIEFLFGSIALVLLFGLTYSFATAHHTIVPKVPIANHVTRNAQTSQGSPNTLKSINMVYLRTSSFLRPNDDDHELSLEEINVIHEIANKRQEIHQ